MRQPILDSLMKRSTSAFVVHSPNLEVLEWNAGAERLFGFGAGEAVGRHLTALIGGKTTATRKDGSRVACQWQEDVLDDGAVFATVTDISEAKSRERLLNVILENLAVVVWQVDTKGIFNFHDGRKGLADIGMKPGQLLGQNILELFEAGGAEVVRGALAGKATVGVDSAYGKTWQTWTLPLYGEEKAVDGAVGITLDVSDSRAREDELRSRLKLIEEQQKTIRELSIPLIEAWEGVLVIPLVGIVDADRAAEVMERVLTEITRRKARFAILDLTGIDQIDTNAAGNIIGLVRAVQLLGAEGLITGIRPSMAQAIVGLGIDLGSIRTLANLREALGFCLERIRTKV